MHPTSDPSQGDLFHRTWKLVSLSAGQFSERFTFIFKNSLPIAVLSVGVLFCFLGILVGLALAGRSFLLEQGWSPTEAELGLALGFLLLALIMALFALPSVFAIRRQALSSPAAPEKVGETSKELVQDLSRVAKESLRPSVLLQPHAKTIIAGAAVFGFLIALAAPSSDSALDAEDDF